MSKDYSNSRIPNLFKLMEESGTSAAQLSNAIGATKGNISDWKSGKSKPSKAVLNSIANYFGVSVDYLLGYTDEIIKEKSPAKVSEDDLKVALFGGDKEVTDEMWNEVLDYAKYLKQKYNKP